MEQIIIECTEKIVKAIEYLGIMVLLSGIISGCMP